MSDVIQILDIIAWPLVVVGILFLLTSRQGSQLTKAVMGRTSRVKALGVEWEFSEEEGRRLKAGLEDVLKSYRDEVEVEFDRQVKCYDVERLLAIVAEEVIEEALEENPTYQCTVYVPDIVFTDVLYRLLNYYPGGAGKGSTYSTRFGIIGRAWRLGKSQHADVPSDRETLIGEWGMTREEAASQRPKSYATFLLTDTKGNPTVGMLYIEAREGAIPKEKLEKALQEAASVTSLTESVQAVMDEVRGSGPYLQLFDD